MKVAICIPVYGDTVRLRFAACLARLGIYSAPRFTLETLWNSGILPDNRNQLAAQAIQWGADWTLWIDSDQTFPPDTLERLLAHNLPLVGANILRRDGTGPTAGHINGERAEGLISTKEKAAAGLVEKVDLIGMGLMLISPVVFRAVNGLFKTPPFEMRRHDDGRTATEDYDFIGKARKAGFAAHVDHALSMEVGHLAETELKFDARPLPAS